MKVSLTFESGTLRFEAVPIDDFERRMLAVLGEHDLVARVDRQHSDYSGRVVLVIEKAPAE